MKTNFLLTSAPLALAWSTAFVAFSERPAFAANDEDVVKVRVRVKGKGDIVRRAEMRIGDKRVFSGSDGVLAVSKTSDFSKCTVAKSGFEESSCTHLNENSTGVNDIFLIPSADNQVTTIVITGQDDVSSSKKIISKEELKRIAPGDPTKAIRFMPGVQTGNRMGGGGQRGGGRGGGGGGGGGQNASAATAVSSSASVAQKGADGARFSTALASNSGVSIRGSSASESKYYLDDIEVPYVFHSMLDLSVVPGALIDSIQFESGGFSARYGNAMGGVVVLNTPATLAQKSEGEVTVNLPFYSGAYYRAPLNETSTMSVSYRRSYLDFFLKYLIDKVNPKMGSSVGTLSPVISDAHVQYLHKGADGSRQKITLLGVSDGIKAVFSSRLIGGGDTNFSFSSGVDTGTFAVEQEDSINDAVRYHTTPQVSVVRGTTAIGDNVAKSTQVNARVPLEILVAARDNVNFSVGVDPNVNTMTSTTKAVTLNQTTGVSTENDYSASYTVGNPAFWEVVNWRWGDFEIVPQTRTAYNTQIKRAAFDPRLNISYHVTEKNTLKGAVGRFSMAPTAAQASEGSGNPNLSFQRMYQYILGVETRWTPELTTDVQTYFKDGYGIVTSDPFTRYNNDARTRAWGVEFMVRRAFTGRWFSFLSYSYSKTQEQNAPGESFKRSPNDQTHIANLVGSYRFYPTWELSGTYRYNTSGVYIPSTGAFYNSASDRYVPHSSTVEKDLPAYQSVSFYLGKEFLYDTWQIQMRTGLESWWPSIQVASMQPTFNYSKDVARANISAIPFFEVKGVF